jgi:DNA-binding XRE family transcriptional regulator
MHGEIKTPPFSKMARLDAGFLLRLLQRGEKIAMPHSRPMPSVGRRCHELRIPDDNLSWRIVYRIDEDAIVIAEVFLRRPARNRKASLILLKRDFESMTMDKRKKQTLAKQVWKTGPVAEFLDLSAEESAYIEMKLALSEKLRERRRRKKLTQAELAKAIESSQSRVAKMEAGDPTVSIDLLVKSLLALGVSKKELGRTIS